MAFLCRYYGASRSGFYAWRRREEAPRVKADRELRTKIRRLHEDSRGTYGSPRVYRALRGEGIRVGEKRVARLMREARLKARIARVYRRQPGLHRFFAKTPNLRLVNRHLRASTRSGSATSPTCVSGGCGGTWLR